MFDSDSVFYNQQIIRICSPVYMKSGNVRVAYHGELTTASDGIHMAEQMATVLEHIRKYSPEATQSSDGTGPAIPVQILGE